MYLSLTFESQRATLSMKLRSIINHELTKTTCLACVECTVSLGQSISSGTAPGCIAYMSSGFTTELATRPLVNNDHRLSQVGVVRSSSFISPVSDSEGQRKEIGKWQKCP
ncbi:hypothetical protein BJX68DRAFT_38242 [Aspergillus pseudodeflectus]|uniref:Uncharacterized protein n=1 Tax=Aspergillus pseudodeflectus TaxID=176178 RepID=A0ABR4KP26_9EURO